MTISDNAKERPRLVGIGASAGGLEALRELLAGLPDSDAFSYVIAQHVSPTHASMLMSLLAPKTVLTVQDLTDNQIPEGGTIYITPPNRDVVLQEGVLRLTEPQQAIGPKPSVNHFFHSMAETLGDQAIGIILSGTGSDGASGLKAIKAAGGVAIVQEPDSAKYDGMPKAAIHTGSVDLILRPAEIGIALERLISALPEDVRSLLNEESESDEYAQITNLVRLTTAFRLSDYKSTTVRRRIARRMNIRGIHSLHEYIDYLRVHKDEGQALMRDTFISVTEFFRDETPFAALNKVIDDLVRTRQGAGVVRCWIPGCASGEEAYSIAMLFEEAISNQQRNDLQYMIFASDLDDGALEQARSGLYPTNELDGVPIALRDRYTENVGNFIRVNKNIRNRLVFARQNVIEDPPFARLDLISCRNLMIYFNPPVQQRLLEVFHYALSPGGHLFLGKSESADGHKDLFKSVDSRARIYARLEGTTHYALPAAQNFGKATAGRKDEGNTNAPTNIDVVSLRTLERLAECFAPPSLVINDADVIIHFQGDLKPYLSFPKGRAEMYLFDLLANDVRAELRALTYRCRRDLQTVHGGSWNLEIDGQAHVVTPIISPLVPGVAAQLLLSFQATPASANRVVIAGIDGEARDNLIINELEQELANTRTHLNVVVEELETSNEELQSLNEELQSTNEELQSTNEELQTSNEELQSTNEELLTVNEELQVKGAELEEAVSDLKNIKDSLSFPLLVVDSALRVKDLNAACANIVAIDMPLEHSSLSTIQWKVEVPGLMGQVRQVIETGDPLVFDVAGIDNKTFDLHILPNRTAARHIDGAVLVFNDVTHIRQANAAIEESERRFRLLASNVQGYALVMLDTEGHIVTWNEGAKTLKGYEAEEAIGQPMSLFYTPEDIEAGLPFKLLARARETGHAKHIGWRVRKDGTRFLAELVISAIYDEQKQLTGFAKITRDVTKEHNDAEAMSVAQAQAEAASVAKMQFLANMSHEIRTPMNAICGLTHLLKKKTKDPEQLDKLGKINTAADHLLSIINDILDLSKIEANKLILDQSDFDIGDLFSHLNDMVLDSAKAKGLQLAIEIDPTIEGVHGDKGRLGQALLNYLGNAVKFTDKGYVRMSAQLLEADEDGSLVRFEVEDSGCGISSDAQFRLFQAFEQADNSTTRKYGGTGLGLAITRRIAQLMGGEVGVESTEGVGSTFWLTARLGVVDAESERYAIPELKGKRALVVDDVATHRLVLVHLLNRFGLVADATETAVDAITQVTRADDAGNPYDLLLVDMFMPGLDGFQTLATIHDLRLTRQPIPWLVTASYDEQILNDASNAGFKKTLLKPIHFIEMQKALLELTPAFPSPEKPVETPANISVSDNRFENARVLIVDDEPINGMVAAELLDDAGLKSDYAEDGLQALKLLAENDYDLILMDMQMPILDGLEATRQIRQRYSTKRIVIIAMTANVLGADRKRCFEAGMDDFIGKPFEPDELIRTVQHWLEMREQI